MKVKLGITIISKNTSGFLVSGIKPSLFNAGSNDVEVLERTLKPGQDAPIDFGDHEVEHEIDVEFKGTGKNKLVVYTGIPIKDSSKNCDE
ncbi:hypothetical protein [Flavobacteriaceae bacterium 14752]|uniref:hypothetical protein n=1 Tax=Mesohalobacter salilacus TaxID=2491711 RepID=UPI000F637D49|nr:hypothetical protein EIG84_05880 [Flavobacteriaceae bacterium 14752]